MTNAKFLTNFWLMPNVCQIFAELLTNAEFSTNFWLMPNFFWYLPFYYAPFINFKTSNENFSIVRLNVKMSNIVPNSAKTRFFQNQPHRTNQHWMQFTGRFCPYTPVNYSLVHFKYLPLTWNARWCLNFNSDVLSSVIHH